MRAAGLSLVLLTVGCGSSDPTTNPVDLNGTYRATTFTIAIQGRATSDVLAAGGSVNLTLNPGQTTAGRLVIPAAAGGPFDDNLAGTYRITGKNTIQFVPIGSTFIDGYLFTSDPPELRAFVSLQQPNPGSITLILKKQ